MKNLIVTIFAIFFTANVSAQPLNKSEVIEKRPPMITTIWGQGNELAYTQNEQTYFRQRYNDLCPYDSAVVIPVSGMPSIKGAHAYVGCNAVTMAQIIKYWSTKTTLEITGSHSYTHSKFGVLSANFGNTTYKWHLMVDSLQENSTTEEKFEIAQLMYHCGVSVNMNYRATGSSTSGGFVPPGHKGVRWALPDYWGFKNEITQIVKDTIEDSRWLQLIVAELNAGRPINYGSSDHSYICDGWGIHNGDTVLHMNFGYASKTNYNGYYRITKISSAAGNFTNGQYAMMNIIPRDYVTDITEPNRVIAAVKAYPNPTQGMVTIETESNAKLQLFNTTGQLLIETIGNQIDLSSYPNGLYFLKVDGKSTVKLIKQ